MFCQHCGYQLPEGAKFCSNCGKIAVQSAQPSYSPAQYQQPQQKVNSQPQQTAPYTVPVDQADSSQYASSWSASQQQPSYTEPVHGNSASQQMPPTVPVNHSAYQPNSGNVPPYSSYTPGNQTSNSAQPPQQPQQPKRVRKLPILLAAIAVLAILLVVISGGKKDKSKVEKLDKAEPTTSQVGGSKAGTGDEKQQSSGKRYTDEGFTFADEDFPGLYEAVLKAHNSEFVLANSYATTGTGYQWDLLNGDAPVIYYGTYHDPDTDKITRVYAGHNGLTEGYEEIVYEEFEAIMLLIEAAYGEMTDTQWEYINEMEPSYDTDNIKIYDYDLDGLKIKVTVTENALGLDVCVKDYQVLGQKQTQSTQATTGNASSANPDYIDINGALARFPDGTLNFDSKSFKMTTDELCSLFQYYMDQDGVALRFGKRSPQDDGKYHYNIENDQGTKVGYVVVKVDTATNKVKEASFTYNYQPDEEEHTYGTSAVLNFIEAGHGAMTDKQWEIVANAEPFAEKEEYIMVAYKLDGMKATLTLRADQLFISLKLAS